MSTDRVGMYPMPPVFLKTGMSMELSTPSSWM